MVKQKSELDRLFEEQNRDRRESSFRRRQDDEESETESESDEIDEDGRGELELIDEEYESEEN